MSSICQNHMPLAQRGDSSGTYLLNHVNSLFAIFAFPENRGRKSLGSCFATPVTHHEVIDPMSHMKTPQRFAEAVEAILTLPPKLDTPVRPALQTEVLLFKRQTSRHVWKYGIVTPESQPPMLCLISRGHAWLGQHRNAWASIVLICQLSK